MTFHFYPSPTPPQLPFSMRAQVFAYLLMILFLLRDLPWGEIATASSRKPYHPPSPFPLPFSLFHALIAKQESPLSLCRVDQWPKHGTRIELVQLECLKQSFEAVYYFIDWGLTFVLKSVVNSV